jgi:hypothetical protein
MANGISGSVAQRVYEGPTGSWPGAVSPAEVVYEQLARMHAQPERQQPWSPVVVQRIGSVAELGAILDAEHGSRAVDIYQV